MDFTLADLVKICGAKRRSVQLWAEAGVLRADDATERGGSGTHRRFDMDEAMVACVVAEFARTQTAIGGLIQISEALHQILANHRSLEIFKRAGRGEGSSYLIFKLPQTDDIAFLLCSDTDEAAADLNFFKALRHLDQYDGVAFAINLNTSLAGLRDRLS